MADIHFFLAACVVSCVLHNAHCHSDSRSLVSSRNERRLPGSKGSTPPAPAPPRRRAPAPAPPRRRAPSPVSCAGSWGAYGACDGSQKKQTYTISQNAENGGTACASAGGATNTAACKNCVGSWSAWGACASSKKKQTYTISQNAESGGTACASAGGATKEEACQNPVNCVGSWSAWGACAGSQKKQTYTISQTAAHGGTACASAGGATKTEACNSPVNCAGSWGAWGACAASQKKQTYTISQNAVNGGTACPSAGGATKTEACKSCVGSWSAWGACAGSQKKQTYTISQNAENGGTACASAGGATKTEACVMQPVNCVGSWGSWAACIGRKEVKTYKISLAAAHGGAACPTADGATKSQTCDPNMKQDVDWKYVIPKGNWGSTAAGKVELPIVVCSKGGSVTFKWTESHDVWQLPSESAYVDCAFKDQQSKELAKSTSNQYTFKCDNPGTHFFACSMNNACQQARQRIRVQVTDPASVASLKTTVDAVTKVLVPTMANIMQYDIADVDYNGYSSDTRAAQIVERLKSAMRYSPTSCGDWIPAYMNNNDTCVAWLASDLGFVMRSRPTPSVQASRDYYALSLKHDPKHCGTMSYLAELEVMGNRKEQAIAQATKACAACGASIDVLSIAKSFNDKGWTLPASCPSKCGSTAVDCGASMYKDASKAMATTGDTAAKAKTNCCTAKATCANGMCAAGTKLKTSAASTMCSGKASTCVQATCCEAVKCGESKVTCGAGKYQDSTKAAKALGNDAGVSNCCTPMATCASATCGSGNKVITSAAASKCLTDAKSCVLATCCAAQKCSDSKVTCGAGKYQDSTKAAKVVGGDAGVTNCCTPMATCASATCGVGTKAIASSASTKCPGDAKSCVLTSCCEDRKCIVANVKCGAGRYQDTAKAAMALGGDAGVTNCCTAMATCASATCGVGTKAIASSASTKCPGDAKSCVLATCCETQTCGNSKVTCGSDKYQDSAKAAKGLGADAGVTNCCTPVASCANAACGTARRVTMASATVKCASDAKSCVQATCCEAVTSDTKAPTVVTGTIKFDVQLPATVTAESFVKDAGVKKGVEKGIAKKLDVPPSWVSATLTVGSRRLAQTRKLGKHLHKPSINVEFKVTIYSTAKATQSAAAVQSSLTSATKESDKNAWGKDLTDSVKEEAVAYKDIQVSVSSVARVVVATTTTKPWNAPFGASLSTRSCLASIFLIAFVAGQWPIMP